MNKRFRLNPVEEILQAEVVLSLSPLLYVDDSVLDEAAVDKALQHWREGAIGQPAGCPHVPPAFFRTVVGAVLALALSPGDLGCFDVVDHLII